MQLLIRTQALTVMDSPHFTFNHFTSTRFFFFFYVLREQRALRKEKRSARNSWKTREKGKFCDGPTKNCHGPTYWSAMVCPTYISRSNFGHVSRSKKLYELNYTIYIYMCVHSWLQKFVDGKCREIRKEIGSIFPFRAEEFRKIVKLPETNFTRNFFFLSTEKIFIRRLSSVSIFLFNETENDNRSRVA